MIYVYGGIVSCLLILAGLLVWRGHEIDRLNVDIKQLHADVHTLTQANIDQAHVISVQEAALADFKRLADASATQMQRAVADLTRAQVARDKANLQLMELDQKERAKSECAAVLNQDIKLACPDTAADMLKRAE